MASRVVAPDRRRAEGRAAGGADMDRLRPRERHRLPHLHRPGARSVRRAVLLLPARTDAEAATRRAACLAQRRIPRLTVGRLSVRSHTTILLSVGAAAAWAVTVERMRGMDSGPGTDLGGLGWFLGIWVTMTAAMMLPSAVPAAGHVALLALRNTAPLVVAGHLAVWTVYEVTPLKRWSLRRCRSAEHPESPMGSGFAHGFYCVTSSGALMAVLLVLGVMSLFWMALRSEERRVGKECRSRW